RHAVRQAEPAQPVDNAIDGRGRHRDDDPAAGPEQAPAFAPEWGLVADVFEGGEQYDGVEGGVRERSGLPEAFGEQAVARRGRGLGGGMGPRAGAEALAEAEEKSAGVTADVEDAGAGGNPGTGHTSPPLLQDAVQETHGEIRSKGVA